MLAALDAIFEFAAGGAVGGFTCYDATTGIAVVEEAQRRSMPVILLVGVASADESCGSLLIGALRAIAERADVAVCVQLDHARDLATVERALRAGASGVMIDGSTLPFDENVRLTRQAVQLARSHSAGVEAELGHVAGGEDVATETAVAGMTDPAEAVEFVGATGIDCLAIAVGNVHGVYATPPQLDADRIAAIERVVAGVPLALHGASGVPDEQVRGAVAKGIRKINVNTEIRARVFAELANVSAYADGYRTLDLNAALRSAIAEVVGEKLMLLGSIAGADGVTPIRRVDHVGIAVHNTELALRHFTGRLGLEVVHVEVVEELAVRLTYLDAGNVFLQLVEPLDDSSPVSASLAQDGEGVHHICFAVDDVSAGASELAETDEEARIGRGRGRKAAFVPGPVRHGVRIECTEFDRGADVNGSPGWLEPAAPGEDV